MAKLTRIQFKKQLAEFAISVRSKIESECDGFSTEQKDKAARIERVKNGDFWFFAETYFPHYIKPVQKSEFHEYLSELLPAVADKKTGHKEALAAPRGESKSTIVTQIFSLYCIALEKKHFIGIIMDISEQAVMMLEGIKAELDTNPRLQSDFPDCFGQGATWQETNIVTANKIRVMTAGARKKLRGWKFGANRPDLIILDDLENDENVNKLELRKKLEKWINSAVLKLGPPDGSMTVLYIGTLLHYDSVLNRILNKPTWRSRKFKAIIKWPDNMKLWEEWEEILLNSKSNNSEFDINEESEADKFYKKHEKEMLKGSIVSWPGMRPLKLLMELRADDHDAFESEMQNNPSRGEDAIFQKIHYWVVPCRDWIYFGAVDPSLGKNNKKGDPSAILVGGIDRNTGVLDVVEANIKRRLPSVIINDTINYQKEYNCLRWVVEAVQFQEFLRTQLVAASAILGVPVPALPVIPNTDKNLRIESIQPHTENGLIRLHRNQTTLYEQLSYWPEANHDDGPDALEMLWKTATSGITGIPKIKTLNIRQRLNLAGMYGH